MDTKDDTKLNPLEEYKAVREEIMVYQQEMHRTWLWAIIPAGAVYTWLALHMNGLSNVRAFWFIPAVLVLLCFIRYLGFSHRIERLALYQCKLEENAYQTDGLCDERLCGLARWNRRRHLSPSSATSWSEFWRWMRKPLHPMALLHPMASLVGASCVWLGLLVGCVLLSCALSQTDPMAFLSGAFVVWLGLLVSYGLLSCALALREQEDAHPAAGVLPAAQISSPAPSQSAAFALSTSVASPPGASTPASSEPTHKA
jgi:hypothetical protein